MDAADPLDRYDSGHRSAGHRHQPVNYYAPTILQDSGLTTSAALVATVAVGATLVLSTIIGIWLLGFIPRRRMLITGFSGVAISQGLLALVFVLPASTPRSYIILGTMMLFVGFMAAFIATSTWLLLAEMFPLAIRGFAMGIAVFALWTTNASISFLFPVLLDAWGPSGTFGGFVIVNLVSLLFIIRNIPETQGRSLEQIEMDFRTHQSAGGGPSTLITHPIVWNGWLSFQPSPSKRLRHPNVLRRHRYSVASKSPHSFGGLPAFETVHKANAREASGSHSDSAD